MADILYLRPGEIHPEVVVEVDGKKTTFELNEEMLWRLHNETGVYLSMYAQQRRGR